MAVYWGCHQRFFKQLIVSLKVGKNKINFQTISKVSVLVTGKNKNQ